MKIKRKCSCCKRDITEKDVKVIGETKLGIWFNCKFCHSTMILETKGESEK